MRARWLAIPIVLAATACSLVFGLHDNVPPVAPSPGCAADAGAHTFCELFDESPSWPADAMMLPVAPATGLSLSGDEAGCFTPPHCLYAIGDENYAERTIATSKGLSHLKYDFHARFELIDSGVVPRVAWIDLDVGQAQPIEFGVTFAHDTDTNDYEVFVFGSPSAINSYDYLVPVTIGTWFHLTLDVDTAAHTVSLTSLDAPSQSRTYDYVGQWQLPTFAPTDVKSATIYGGISTGVAHTAATLDSIVVDVQP
jgi:hypothetical protein